MSAASAARRSPAAGAPGDRGARIRSAVRDTVTALPRPRPVVLRCRRPPSAACPSAPGTGCTGSRPSLASGRAPRRWRRASRARAGGRGRGGAGARRRGSSSARSATSSSRSPWTPERLQQRFSLPCGVTWRTSLRKGSQTWNRSPRRNPSATVTGRCSRVESRSTRSRILSSARGGRWRSWSASRPVAWVMAKLNACAPSSPARSGICSSSPSFRAFTVIWKEKGMPRALHAATAAMTSRWLPSPRMASCVAWVAPSAERSIDREALAPRRSLVEQGHEPVEPLAARHARAR